MLKYICRPVAELGVCIVKRDQQGNETVLGTLEHMAEVFERVKGAKTPLSVMVGTTEVPKGSDFAELAKVLQDKIKNPDTVDSAMPGNVPTVPAASFTLAHDIGSVCAQYRSGSRELSPDEMLGAFAFAAHQIFFHEDLQRYELYMPGGKQKFVMQLVDVP